METRFWKVDREPVHATTWYRNASLSVMYVSDRHTRGTFTLCSQRDLDHRTIPDLIQQVQP